MHTKTSVLAIHTGGTIASTHSDSGLRPKKAFDEIFHTVRSFVQKEDKELLENILLKEVITPFEGVDSSQMTLGHIEKIARTISDNYTKYDAFLITHGTDTMAYTASFLYYMLEGINKPVILTGSQKTLEEEESDVFSNLIYALLATAAPNSGVWIVFGDKIMPGEKTMKIDTRSFNAFDINGKCSCDMHEFMHYGLSQEREENFFLSLSEKVEIIALSHTTTAFSLKGMLCARELQAVVLLVHGQGGARDALFEAAGEWAKDNDALIVAKSYSPYGMTDLSRYKAGEKALQAGILSAGEMTLEAIYAKLSIAVKKFETLEKRKKYFLS